MNHSQPKENSYQDLIDQFWEIFPPTWNRIRAHVQMIASDQFGITGEQFHILRHIRKGAASVSDLAEVKQISRSATSQAVEILVVKGLVVRQQAAGDRRCMRLALTPEGNHLLTSIFKANRAWMMEKLQSVPAEQVEQITSALHWLKNAFDRD
jgi:DNA-binding MarR family transcriptional regulator